MIDSLIIKCCENDQYLVDLKVVLDKLSVQELLKIFDLHSSSRSIRKYKNIEEVLNIVIEVIARKLDDLSIMDAINIFADNYIRVLEDTERHVIPNRNIVELRESKLNKNDYFEREAKIRKMNREDYFNDYVLMLSSCKKQLDSYELIFKLIDKLQEHLYNYIVQKFEKLSLEEKEQVIKELDGMIEKNEIEISNKKKMLSDREYMDLLSLYLHKTLYDVCDELNPKMLEIRTNDVYKSFREIFIEYVNGRGTL